MWIMLQGGGKTVTELAADARVGRSYFTRILRLSFLAPEVVRRSYRAGSR